MTEADQLKEALIERIARRLAYASANRQQVRDQGFFGMKYPNGCEQYAAEQWHLFTGDASEALQVVAADKAWISSALEQNHDD